jgi:phosphatidylglycerophosphatase A
VGKLGRIAALALATAGGAGYAPAPGTCGSLVAVVLLLLFPNGAWYFWCAAAGAFLASAGCIALGAFAEREFQQKDPGFFVLDEVAGMLVAALALDKPPLHWIAAAFALFRYFDIKKPLGIARLQRLRGGAGILIDDLAAGGCALAVTQGCRALATIWESR